MFSRGYSLLIGLIVTLAVMEVNMLLENMRSSLHLCRQSAVRKQVNSRDDALE